MVEVCSSDCMREHYYTWDFNLQPIGAIWRSLKKESTRSLVWRFPYHLVRKLLRLRYPASYGVCHTSEFPPVADDGLPAEAKLAFGSYEDTCKSHDFEHVRNIESPLIGYRTRFVSYWLNNAGTSYCCITWTRFAAVCPVHEETTFECNTSLATGCVLRTIALAADQFIPELVAPWQYFRRLPIESDPATVIEEHQRRISSHNDLLIFDHNSLMRHAAEEFRKFLDFLIESGMYGRLTESEAARLLALNNSE